MGGSWDDPGRTEAAQRGDSALDSSPPIEPQGTEDACIRGRKQGPSRRLKVLETRVLEFIPKTLKKKSQPAAGDAEQAVLSQERLAYQAQAFLG